MAKSNDEVIKLFKNRFIKIVNFKYSNVEYKTDLI